ncbi:uncharacterized protein BO80DRAFT_369955 [Aspergillus ibericus CBS 121593]|uniref:Uncharacterized protein n=1 Tax=Aspergillus ibericus CBS 121593 TaxID=1448316 RepID=A0A395GHQ5_9EURO|nr:hypothetical protein BO80DRAFT_369955 [Aspergillus ibericus CBS 121593]RAK94955.1 hypothetical protein BO80DRAFT_369955 [Aspergillus ibericus CBS 121593]
MMSQTTSDTPHLFEDDLPESANTERKIFAEWASSVPFKKQAEDFEIHNSVELDIKLAPFLRSLNLSSKGYSLVQIPGPEHAPFHHSKGDAFIIPIEILDGSPSASGKPLREGKRLLMKANHEVKIGPKLRLLFILL